MKGMSIMEKEKKRILYLTENIWQLFLARSHKFLVMLCFTTNNNPVRTMLKLSYVIVLNHIGANADGTFSV